MDDDDREPTDPADVRAAAGELAETADDLVFDRAAGLITRGEYEAAVADLGETADPEVVAEARRAQERVDEDVEAARLEARLDKPDVPPEQAWLRPEDDTDGTGGG